MTKAIAIAMIAVTLAWLWIALHGVVFTNYYPNGFEVGVSWYVGSLS